MGQSVPCPQAPDSCQFPDNFAEYLELSPGPPLAESQWTGTLCTRDYRNISVSVDLVDDTSAQIVRK